MLRTRHSRRADRRVPDRCFTFHGRIEMTRVPLHRGGIAIVDDDDAARVNEFQWRLHIDKGTNSYAFARNTVKAGYSNLHRFILKAERGQIVDHIDGNGLNCTRENMRICDAKGNRRNSRPIGGSSKFKGVSWDKQRERWRAIIYCDGVMYRLGRFRNEIDAALAYDDAASRLFGEFAWLNFP